MTELDKQQMKQQCYEQDID